MRRVLWMTAIISAAALLTSCYGSGTSAPPGAELASGTLNNGEQYAKTFAAAGSFPYKCTIHGGCQGLFGTVVVVAQGVGISGSVRTIHQADGGSCFTLSAPTDTVHVGESVTWINDSRSPHTVTSR